MKVIILMISLISIVKAFELLCDGLDPLLSNSLPQFIGELGNASDAADCYSKCVSHRTCTVVAFGSSDGVCYGYTQYSGTCDASVGWKTYGATCGSSTISSTSSLNKVFSKTLLGSTGAASYSTFLVQSSDFQNDDANINCRTVTEIIVTDVTSPAVSPAIEIEDCPTPSSTCRQIKVFKNKARPTGSEI